MKNRVKPSSIILATALVISFIIQVGFGLQADFQSQPWVGNGWTYDNPDVEYYLGPAVNLVEGVGLCRADCISIGDYLRRVFVCPFWIALHLLIFGVNGHLVLPFSQFILFACSLFLLLKAGRKLNIESVTLVVCLIIALHPYIAAWNFYTITEPLTISMTIIFLSLIMINMTRQKEDRKYLWLGIVFALMVYTRPYTALFGIFFVIPALQSLRRGNFKHLLAMALPLLLMASVWTIRNYKISNEIVPLEKAFHPSSLDRMKPEFRGFLSYTKTWALDGPLFNQVYMPLYFELMYNGETEQANEFKEQMLNSIPDWIRSEVSDEQHRSAIQATVDAVLAKRDNYNQGIALPNHWLDEEVIAEKKWDDLKSIISDKYWIRVKIAAPLIYGRRLIVHSGTANVPFLNNRQLLSIPGLFKAICYVLHLLPFLLLLFLLFQILKMDKGFEITASVIVILLGLLFFSFVHKEIEQRYFLPFWLTIWMAVLMLIAEKNNLNELDN